PGRAAGRAATLARAALKFAGALLLAAAVEGGFADGDELDEVGCTVAQQAKGASHSAGSGATRERGDGKVPGSAGGSGGGGDGGGDAGGKAEIRKAETLKGEELSVREMLRAIHEEIAAVRSEFGELRSAKRRLEKMLAEGVFAFTRKVDA